MDGVEENAGRVEGAPAKSTRDACRTEHEPREHDGHEEHPGGGRFNRRLLVVLVGIAMIVGAVAVEGIRSAGVTTPSAGLPSTDDSTDAARNKAEVGGTGCRRATTEPAARSCITNLITQVQDAAVRDGLSPFSLAGPLGRFLDADRDVLLEGDFVTFELETLMGMGPKVTLVTAAVSYSRTPLVAAPASGHPTRAC